jgi:hypothetical protein
MSSRLVVGLLGGISYLLASGLSQAQCSKDTDCKGERVCEAGACIAPSSPPAASSAAEGTPPPLAPQVTPAPAPAPAPAATPAAAPLAPEEPLLTRRKYRRHSTGMMAGGIVMVSFVPIALIAAWVADIEQSQCEGNYYDFGSGQTTRGVNCDRFDPTIYGGLISAAVLLGAGVPLIIVGAKKEPLGTAQITPWATPQAAGLSLRLKL